MQFHLNGFRHGDPTQSGAIKSADRSRASGSLPQQVDVLIVGSGPTGLTLSAQLAAFPGLKTRIVEQKSGPLQIGQADGIACRTMEMFEAFGFSDRVLREAYWVNETCFWKPDEVQPTRIARSRVVQDVEDSLSEFPHVVLNQARVHDFYLDVMRHAPAPIVPDYSRRLVDLKVDESLLRDRSSYPLIARIELAEEPSTGTSETVRARYLVGCDGARSAVRRFMGRKLAGDSANQAWGVMDVLAVTDFPDIRRKTAIQSAEEGSMLIIPREGGYLVRMYIELEKLAENRRVEDLNVTTDKLIGRARRILNPYRLEVREIAWWSVYEIGQRLCERFDDLPSDAGEARFPRVFIAGDACHTHSPKAGQGMNVSMQDAFNLGWKLAAVVLGRATPQLLNTYSAERQAVAKDLIDFDQAWARMFSERPKRSNADRDDGIDPKEFQEHFIRNRRFTAGTATRYARSLIIGNPKHQDVAKGFTVGMRFHSAPAIRLADGKLVHVGHTVRADGRWRLFAFADAAVPSDSSSLLRAFCEYLERSPHSPLRRYTRSGEDIDSLIEVVAICQQSHHELSVTGMPTLLLPRKGKYELIDYEKIYCPDFKGDQDIFETRGIDRSRGAVVVVRPDQHVAHVLPLDELIELELFFDRFMRPEGCGSSS